MLFTPLKTFRKSLAARIKANRHRLHRQRKHRSTVNAIERLEDRTLLSSSTSWAFAFSGLNGEQIKDVERVDNGDVILAGRMDLTSFGADPSAALAQFQPDGTFVSSVASSGDFQIRKTHLDSDGNVYAVARFRGDVTVGGVSLTSQGDYDIFVGKFNSSMELQWQRQFGAEGNDSVWAISFESLGGFSKIYITGSISNTVVFDGIVVSSSGETDILVAQLDALTGQVDWATAMGGDSSEGGFSVDADLNGNVYVTGRLRSQQAQFGTFVLDTPNRAIFASKLDNVGTVMWANQFGGDTDPFNESGRAIVVDDSDSLSENWALYFTGSYNGQANFDTFSLPEVGGDDAFVGRLNANDGAVVWVGSLAGVGQDILEDLSIDADANVYTVGNFGSIGGGNQVEADFDPSPTSERLIGEGSAFLSKLNSDGEYVGAWRIGNFGQKWLTTDDFGAVTIAGEFGGELELLNGFRATELGSGGAAVMRMDTNETMVRGTVFADLDQDGLSSSEPGLPDWAVFSDLNDNDILDPGETMATTTEFGVYVIELPTGTHSLKIVNQNGWVQTGDGSLTVIVDGLDHSIQITNKNFGVTSTSSTFVSSDYSATDLPKKVIDGKTTRSIVSVSDSLDLIDVNVTLNLEHEQLHDMFIDLVAPTGDRIPLVDHNRLPLSGQNLSGTVFNDDATQSIRDGVAPYSGNFRPIDPLISLRNLNSQGEWTLEIFDTGVFRNKPGNLTSWTLSLVGFELPVSPAIIVAPTSGLVTTEKNAGTDSFTVVLDTQPTADVTIVISSSDTTEGTVDVSSLTFTTANWDTPQTVTVTGVDDSVRDGDIDYTIVTAAAVSADTDYNGLDAADVSATNEDDEKGKPPKLMGETTGDGNGIIPLSQPDAEAFAEFALQLWIGAEGISEVPHFDVIVADLPGNQLGMTNGNVITLDIDAAGVGWFVDTTPFDNSEFEFSVNSYDLLTAVAHEVGHALGFNHENDGVMAETLAVGERHLPGEEPHHESETFVISVFDSNTQNDPTSDDNIESGVITSPQPLAEKFDYALESSIEIPLTDGNFDFGEPVPYLPEEDLDADSFFSEFENSLLDDLLAIS